MVLDQLRDVEMGRPVRGSDDRQIGRVSAIHDDYLLVEGGIVFKHDLYVPVDAVTAVRDEGVVVGVAAADVEAMGWRYPPERGHRRGGPAAPTDAPTDTTSMTGAAFGAGAGVSSAGPLGPGHGDAIEDRLGGSGRAGLSGQSTRRDDHVEPHEDEPEAD